MFINLKLKIFYNYEVKKIVFFFLRKLLIIKFLKDFLSIVFDDVYVKRRFKRKYKV